MLSLSNWLHLAGEKSSSWAKVSLRWGLTPKAHPMATATQAHCQASRLWLHSGRHGKAVWVDGCLGGYEAPLGLQGLSTLFMLHETEGPSPRVMC